MLRFLCTIILVLQLLQASFSLRLTPSAPRSLAAATKTPAKSIISAALGVGLALTLQRPTPAMAVQGSVQPSTLAQSKAAAKQIAEALDFISEMDKSASAGDFAAVASVLNKDVFQKFDKVADVLVRSEALSSEDKTSLGTIKRYGVVADAIIMVGGLSAVLKEGGLSVGSTTSGYADQKPIEDEEEADVDETAVVKKVDAQEAKKYLKLVRGAYSDILKIVSPLLTK